MSDRADQGPSAAPGEFSLIGTIVEQLGAASRGSNVLLGPGDDAALIEVPSGEVLVTSIDTLLPDVHFPAGAAPQLIGERALRVSVSDLAAMGAQPLGCVISLVLPTATSTEWVRGLSQGFAAAARQCECPVTGGNLSAGPLSICVTVQGAVAENQALLRSGAQPGDDVWVSGALGGAAVALSADHAAVGLADIVYSEGANGVTSVTHLTAAQQQYFLPQPQLALGIALRDIASAAIDISDGLAADLGHIARLSEVAVSLSSEAIPCFAGATKEQALYGGDDYHLCFTAPARHRSGIAAVHNDACRIGVVSSLPATDSPDGQVAVRLDGAVLAQNGFDHFSNRTET